MGISVSVSNPQKDDFFRPGKILSEAVKTGRIDIYVRRLKGLGDVLMAALVTRTLERALPAKLFRVHLVTTPPLKLFLRRLDIVSSIVTEEEVTGSFVVNLQDEVDFLPRCKEKPRLDLMAESVGLSPGDIEERYTISWPHKWSEWAMLLTGDLPKKRIAVAPWATANIRSWPRCEEFISLLLRKGYGVIVLHTEKVNLPSHRNLLNMTGRTTLAQLFSILSICTAAVVVDSGILHACGFLGIPFVGLFGSIDPAFRVTYYRKKETIFLPNSCKICPCWDWQLGACINTSYYLQCMRSISPEMALWELTRLIALHSEDNVYETTMARRPIWGSPRREPRPIQESCFGFASRLGTGSITSISAVD